MKTSHSQEIEFWAIRERAGRRKPWELRWRIDTVQKSKSFRTKALARNYFNDLYRAARDGEHFSASTGEPVSWQRVALSVFDAARGCARSAWHAAADNTRRLTRDSMVRLILASLDEAAVRKNPAPGTAAEVRAAVGRFAVSFAVDDTADAPDHRVVDVKPDTDTAAACLAWVARHSRPVGDFAALDDALGLLDRSCALLKGSGTCAPVTVRRRRSFLFRLLDHGVRHGALSANPLKGHTMRRCRTEEAVNPRAIPDWAQAGRLLDAIAYSRYARDRYLSAFFTLAYLAGTRPSETRAIRESDIVWPDDVTDPRAVPGWGMLYAHGSRSDTGEERSLKGRAAGTVRPIPLPPEAVDALRAHLAEYGTAPDGRLFWHTTPEDAYAVLPGKVYQRAWKRARAAALTTAEKNLNLAERPYDLRHGCASHMIADGVHTPEIARRLGHTVEVLLNTYTHWFNSQEHDANRILDQAYRKRGPLTGHTTPNPSHNPQHSSSDA